jgi:cytochrome c peroxidase
VKRIALLLALAACPKSGDKPKPLEPVGSGSAVPGDAALVVAPLPDVPFGLPARPENPRVTPEAVALGAQLFSDPKLSVAGDRSCATCHDPAHGYSGKVDTAADGKLNLRRTPTLVNLAWAKEFGWDGRYTSLADMLPVHVKGQLGGTVDANAVQALEAFVLTRYEGDSPWDRKERAALARPDETNDPVIAGYRLFMGKVGCGTCHTPPLYTDGSYHAVASNPYNDSGRGRVDATKPGAFKTPTLRGAAMRSAFLHTGSATTAEHAMTHGGAPVTKAELAQLVAFVNALTSTPR